MHYFPICLNIEAKRCIVIGGGRVAARKVTGLLSYGGDVTVVSPELTAELAELHSEQRICWISRGYAEGDLADAFLVIAATDDVGIQRRVHAEAERHGILLNVADAPEWCNFILPATVRQGDFTVSVSTGGKSPALARRLREDLEIRFGPEYGTLVDLLGELRRKVLAMGGDHEENKKIFMRLLHPDFADWVRDGRIEEIAAHVDVVLGPVAGVDEIRKMLAQPAQNSPGGSVQ